MNDVICPQCGQKMRMIKRFKNGLTKTGASFRIQKFHCDVCDHDDVITAGGNNDITSNPNFLSVPKEKKVDECVDPESEFS